MYVLKNTYGRIITGFSSTGTSEAYESRPPLKFHCLSDMVQFLRIQEAFKTPTTVTVHRVIDPPVELLTEEVV